jgi:hypothetical protein
MVVHPSSPSHKAKPGSLNGGPIAHTVYHDVRQMRMPFVERNTDGDVLLAVILTPLSMVEMGNKLGYVIFI